MKIKTKLAAVFLSSVCLGAMADATISVASSQSPTSFSSLSGVFNPVGVNLTNLFTTYGSSFVKDATVSFSNATPVNFTFVGKEAGNTNGFGLGVVDTIGNLILLNTSTPGSTVSTSVLNGNFSFFFYDLTTGTPVSNPSFAIGVAQGADKGKALFVFNDNGSGDGDYDDMVVSVTAVPESETYAMMLAGLGMIGTIARRRNKAKAA